MVLTKDKKTGYFYIGLRKGGPQKRFLVHLLVAETFISLCPVNKEAHHIDGDKTNNCVYNIKYLTRTKHALLHPSVRLTNQQTIEIRRLYKEGCKQIDIASQFGISRSHVNSIIWYRRRSKV
jgi:HNH endonuclease